MRPILVGVIRSLLKFRSALLMPNYSASVKFYSGKGGASDRFVEGLKVFMKQAELMELSDESMDASKYIINFIAKSEGKPLKPWDNPYSVDGLIHKAKYYLAELDLGQASEKAYAAMKLALREYVKIIEEIHSVKIIPNEYAWDATKYNKLIVLIQDITDSAVYNEIQLGWKSAITCHIQGWSINILSEEEVELSHSYIFKSITLIQQLPMDAKACDLLSKSLFSFNASNKAKAIAEAYEQYKNQTSAKNKKEKASRIYHEAQVHFSLNNFERNEVSKTLEELGLDFKEIMSAVSNDFFDKNMPSKV